MILVSHANSLPLEISSNSSAIQQILEKLLVQSSAAFFVVPWMTALVILPTCIADGQQLFYLDCATKKDTAHEKRCNNEIPITSLKQFVSNLYSYSLSIIAAVDRWKSEWTETLEKNVAIPGDKRANLTQDNSSNHWQCFKQWDANGGGVTTSQAVLVGKIIRCIPFPIYGHTSFLSSEDNHFPYIAASHLGDLSERFDASCCSLEVSLLISLTS